jgi:DNA invertase Pin-like site-specific DNA recombinase
MTSNAKIRPEHLARPAIVYVRQSTLDQVRHHQESRRRQYDLAEHARALGWREVLVIDEDLGKSGATAANRAGFQRLVAAVSLGRVGAVVGLEVSRLARNNRDWYQLLDLCGLLNTLIIDAEGIYDPRQLNDRLLLGLKGTMSEAELGWLRQRAHEARAAKARRGELIISLPVGYVQTRDGRIEKHPDQRVQAALTLVWQKFAELGSARQVLLWLSQEQVTLPVLERDPSWGDRLTWRRPHYNSILNLLQNPLYAGAYAFGRTETRTHVIAGVPHTSRGHHRPREQWLVLLRDHHEGYIPWDAYERHQQLLADNAQMKGQMAAGAVRGGRSLLAGLLRCASCGRRLHVTYSSGASRYRCRRNHQAGCDLAFGGPRVEVAIERELLRVLTPGAIEAALASAAQTTEEAAATPPGPRPRTPRGAVRGRARPAAVRRRRAGTPAGSRHAGAALNAALERVAALERRLAAMREAAPPPAAADHAVLRVLAQDFRAVWADPATDPCIKKRVSRLLIQEIRVAPVAERMLDVLIHWAGGTHTRLHVPRNRTGEHRRCTAREVVDVVRDLARQLPDAQIARILNRLGYRTGAGNTWTQQRVISLRHAHDILVFSVEPDSATTLTIEQAARLLGVSTTTVRRLIVTGRLPATQSVPYAPWAIAPAQLGAEALQRAVAAGKAGRTLPQTAPETQLTLTNTRI